MSDDPIAVCLPDIGDHLMSVELPVVGGHMRALRERHLNAAVDTILGRHLKRPSVSTVIALDGWPSLGRSATDFVVDSPPGGLPFRHVGELKWCQVGNDKVYEVIWDLFKMALATQIAPITTAHLITGAPASAWPDALCGDIFDGGTFETGELCRRRFPRGARRPVWDFLLEGGFDRYPERVPARITTQPVASPVELRGPGGVWELRAARVQVEPGMDIPFIDGWPNGARPPDARRPAL